VLFDHLPGDGQSQADAAEDAPADHVQVEKTLEDARHGFGRNAHAVVLDGNFNRVLDMADANIYITAVWAEFDGVVENSRQRPLQAFGIAQDVGQVGIRIQVDVSADLISQWFFLLDGCLDHHNQINWPELGQNQLHLLQKEEIVG